MTALLGSQENWKVVEDGFNEPTNTTNWSNSQLKTLKAMCVKDKATLRRLQVSNLQKKHGIFWRRLIMG